MRKVPGRGADSNAVMYGIEQVCGLYGVQVTRMQSRVMPVKDNRRPSGTRPMFFGKWRDLAGIEHSAGMADMLARPRVPATALLFEPGIVVNTNHPVQMAELMTQIRGKLITVPLWIEVKSGADRLSPEQEAFRHYVTHNGEFHIVCHDDLRPLETWFNQRGVKKANLPPVAVSMGRLPWEKK